MATQDVETYSGRVYSKGATLWFSTSGYTNMTRVAGIVSMPGPPFQRTGNVDGTELSPAPDNTADEEPYYYDLKLPGTKEVGDMTVNLNMVRAQYALLFEHYDGDESLYWEFRLRNGAKFQGRGFIQSLPTDLQDNQLVKVPLVITPQGKWNLVSFTTTTAA